MNHRFILFQRSAVYYCEDTATGKQTSLRTKDKADALRLPWPVIPKRRQSAAHFKSKSAITRKEHEQIIERKKQK